MECPRCQQDFVVACEIPAARATGWYCPECEALWVDGPVGGSPFEQLGGFLRARELDWDDVIDAPPDSPVS